jgi:hypothetical protein
MYPLRLAVFSETWKFVLIWWNVFKYTILLNFIQFEPTVSCDKTINQFPKVYEAPNIFHLATRLKYSHNNYLHLVELTVQCLTIK